MSKETRECELSLWRRLAITAVDANGSIGVASFVTQRGAGES